MSQKNYHPSDYFVIPTVRICEKCKGVGEQALLAMEEGQQGEEGKQSRKVKVRKAIQRTITCLELSFPFPFRVYNPLKKPENHITYSSFKRIRF